MSSYHMVSLKFVDWIVWVESSITYKHIPSEIMPYGMNRKFPENALHSGSFHNTPSQNRINI